MPIAGFGSVQNCTRVNGADNPRYYCGGNTQLIRIGEGIAQRRCLASKSAYSPSLLTKSLVKRELCHFPRARQSPISPFDITGKIGGIVQAYFSGVVYSYACSFQSVKGESLMRFILSAPMSRSVALVVLASFAFTFPGPAAFAQDAPTAKSFEGVWKVTKVVQAGVLNTNPQPGLLIFTRGYYSTTRVTASEARKQAPAPKDPAHLTDAEKIALYNEWAGYGASAGTYEVRGNTIVNHNVVAKMVRGMTLTEEAIILKFDGNSFVARGKPGNPNSDRETTYTRIQ